MTDEPPGILTLHHAGKSGDPRGSTAIQQHSSYMLGIAATSQRDAPITIETIAGCRIAPSAFAPIKIRYRGMVPEPVTPEIVDDRKAAAPKADPLRGKILAALSRDRGVSVNELRAAVRKRKEDVAAMRDTLEAEGEIEQRDGLWYAR